MGGVVAAVAGPVIGSLIGGGGGGGGGSSGGGNTNNTINQNYAPDPYASYRPQAAQQLNTLMNDPSQAIGQPGFAQQLQSGMQQTNRGMAATGQSQSGNEQLALNSQGQNTFASYYNSQVANLMQLSGASQNPAAASQAQTQANLANGRLNQQGFQNMASIGSALYGAVSGGGGGGGNANNNSYFGGSGGGWTAQTDSPAAASSASDFYGSGYDASAGWSM